MKIMKKRDKIIYWVATLWMALGMTSIGIVQLLGMEQEVARITHLGYPVYFLAILGISKTLGVVVLLIPKFPILKEWAYAGFFFTLSGALISHIALGDPINEILPALLLLTLTVVSYYFRPEGRKIPVLNPSMI